ncbi:MAG: prolipoprotein diacylglyceryl transferase, partial [Deltaproteobacteria bacterium]|nr:prolipoprotein diacylglyceryl transferase [Deltaproteobacteria bacterium]
RIKREKGFEITSDQVKDLTTLMMVGLIIGARLGYVLFYNLSYYLKHPLEIILPFEFSNGITFTGISGMSYHGGLIGIALCAFIFTRKTKLSFRQITDLYTPVVPLGYTFGRIGNFINGELFGRVTSSSIGMYFPLAPGAGLRHPSQLYEAFFEGIFIFVVLWSIRKVKKPPGAMFAFYLIGYGTVRFFIEYFRQPDSHLGYILLSFSMGQLLCAAMIACGALLFLYLWKKSVFHH